MLTKQGVAITFLAHYIDSTNLDSETGLTVLIDVYEGANGTPIVSGGSAPEIGTTGVYAYTLASGSVDADTLYWAVFRTTSTAVVQKHLPALWAVGTTLKAVDDVTNVGAAIRTELSTELARIDTNVASRAATGADGDTLETISDQIDAVPALAWTNGERTLTMSAAAVAAAVAGSSITITRGDTLTASLTGLGSIAARTKLWATFKTDTRHTDAQSLIQIVEGATGLAYLNGAAGTAAQGSITVTDEDTGALTIALAAAASDDLPIVSGFYDIQMLTASGVTTLTSGDFSVSADVTRSIA